MGAFWLRVGLREALGQRAPMTNAPIEHVCDRPEWFWIKIGRLSVLMHEYTPGELRHKRRSEPIGFAAARVLGPGETRQAVIDELGRTLEG